MSTGLRVRAAAPGERSPVAGPAPRHPLTPATATERSQLAGALLLTLAFAALIVFGISHHEMWRDEWQAWMLVRDSGSLFELLRQLEYEGHPPAWYIPLFLLSRVTRDPLAMQALHVVTITAGVFLLARYAPLRWHLRVLLAFSYFLAFEYGVIARSYALGVLALFAFCALYRARGRYGLVLMAMLMLLGGTSVYALIIAVAAAGMLLVEELAAPGRSSAHRRTAAVAVTAWAGFSVVMALLVHAMERPSWGSPAQDGVWHSPWALAMTATRLNRAYLPLPDFASLHLWETHFLAVDTRAQLAVGVGLAVLLLAMAVTLLVRKPHVLFFYVVATGTLLAFRHFVFSGSIRHTGHLFLVLAASLWLAALPGREWRPGARTGAWLTRAQRVAGAVLLLILSVQCAAAISFHVADLRHDFSAAPRAAELIRRAGVAHLPMAATPGPEASPIAGIMDLPIHYFDVGYRGTYIQWRDFLGRGTFGFSPGRLRAALEDAGGDMLLILGFPLDPMPSDIAVTAVGRVAPGINQSEQYHIYRLQRRASEPAH